MDTRVISPLFDTIEGWEGVVFLGHPISPPVTAGSRSVSVVYQAYSIINQTAQEVSQKTGYEVWRARPIGSSIQPPP
ncbi:MAG: hypothetical protein NT074_05600 [Methanomicrobiales archaeon]|nr:hypothetical protein [Methanomicrobiales archaeon]